MGFLNPKLTDAGVQGAKTRNGGGENSNRKSSIFIGLTCSPWAKVAAVRRPVTIPVACRDAADHESTPATRPGSGRTASGAGPASAPPRKRERRGAGVDALVDVGVAPPQGAGRASARGPAVPPHAVADRLSGRLPALPGNPAHVRAQELEKSALVSRVAARSRARTVAAPWFPVRRIECQSPQGGRTARADRSHHDGERIHRRETARSMRHTDRPLAVARQDYSEPKRAVRSKSRAPGMQAPAVTRPAMTSPSWTK